MQFRWDRWLSDPGNMLVGLSFSRSTEAMGKAAEAVEGLAQAATATTDAIDGFMAAWDALPAATKEAVGRLDASP